jgi:hypothetical protein
LASVLPMAIGFLALVAHCFAARPAAAQEAGDGEIPFDIDFEVPDGFAVEFVNKPDTVGSIVSR